jgi:hypothetical protein
MRTAYRLLLIAIFGFLMVTCQKEISSESGGPVNPGPLPPPSNGTVTSSVAGRVIDEYGEPVKGASVKTGSSFTTTDINGEFKFNSAVFSEKAAYITVSKSDYFDGSRTFVARQGNKHFVEIQLIPKIEAGSINGPGGGTLNLGNGSSLSLPLNGVVVESSGAPYTGTVKVSMAWIDPTSKDLFRQMPGDLRGTDLNNNAVNMETYGMLGVELKGASGEKLQIAAGKKASLKFPLPPAIQGTAPATIALWSFNDTTGLWKQEGTATKSGNAYLADVGHFSWWNCDIPVTTAANFSATFIDQNGQPLKGAHVIIKKAGGVGFGAHGATDTSGYAGGSVPANESLQLLVEAPYPCSGILQTQNIGPFTTNSNNNLGNITVSISGTSMVTITGTANNCSGSPVTDGFVEVSSGLAIYRSGISANGSFSISFMKCTGGSVSYAVIDNSTSQQSNLTAVNISSGSTNVGTVTACGVSTDQYINYNYDGIPYYILKADSLRAGIGMNGMMEVVGGTIAPGKNWIEMRFPQTTGSIPGISDLFVSNFAFPDGFLVSYTISTMGGGTMNIKVTLNSNGGIGSYIEGSYSGVLFRQGVLHPIQCSFRVKRLY